MTSQIKSDKIYLIGNGVIAKALAVALILNGKNVILLRGSVDDEPDYTELIEVETADQNLKAEVVISTLSSHPNMDGIILLTNKSFGNEQLAEKLKIKAQHCPIVFLQNGLDIEASFISSGFTQLYRCVLFATSQSISATQVRFRLATASPVGIVAGSAEILQHLVSEITTDVFTFRAEENIQEEIWKKVIINCVFNSICPLLEIDNGVFQRSEDALQIARTVIRECLEVSSLYGIGLTEEEMVETVVSLSTKSSGQKISTYQDILSGSETEIETLNLAVSKKAGASGHAAIPVTTLLGQMIKIKADLHKK